MIVFSREGLFADVSPTFKPSASDARLANLLRGCASTPWAVTTFARHAPTLSNYGYWYMLGALWVHYTGHSDLKLWRELFSSKRGGRERGLMKPSEINTLAFLKDPLTVYRAHRPGEADCIAYTLSQKVVVRFAVERGVDKVDAYEVAKADVLCYFGRREEAEVIILDGSRLTHRATIPLLTPEQAAAFLAAKGGAAAESEAADAG